MTRRSRRFAPRSEISNARTAAPRQLYRLTQQRRADPLPAIARADEETDDGPSTLVPFRPKSPHALKPREVLPRTDAAPAHWLLALQRNARMHLSRRHQFAKGPPIPLALALLPQLASSRHAPPHAPAAAVRPVRAEQPLQVGPAFRGRGMDFNRRHRRRLCHAVPRAGKFRASTAPSPNSMSSTVGRPNGMVCTEAK